MQNSQAPLGPINNRIQPLPLSVLMTEEVEIGITDSARDDNDLESTQQYHNRSLKLCLVPIEVVELEDKCLTPQLEGLKTDNKWKSPKIDYDNYSESNFETN